MSTCPLCRVSKTDEHLASGWHNFNQKLFKEGKMPIPRDNYEKFEKQRHEAGESSSSTTSAPIAVSSDTHNVNKWHWEELNLTRWAINRICACIKSIELAVGDDGKITFPSRPTISGDAYINTRKGRTFSGFEMKADITFTAEKGTFSGKGTCHLPEVSADTDDFDYEITNIKIDGADCPEKAALLDAFRSKGRVAIRDAIKTFALEIKEIAKNPSAYNPDEIGGDDSD